MDDLIRRSDAVDMFQRLSYDDWNQGAGTTWANAFSECEELINMLPAVDAVEVRHGRWVQKEDEDWAGGGKTMCSRCKCGYSWKMYFEPESFKFCPNCGAKMDEEDSDERILG